MPYLLAHEVRNLLGDATIKNQCATSRVREVVDDFNIPTLQTRAWGDPLRSRKSLARPQVQANSGDSKSVASCMSDYMLQSHLTSGFVGPGSLSKVHALRAGAGCPPCCSSFKASESMNTQVLIHLLLSKCFLFPAVRYVFHTVQVPRNHKRDGS